MNDTKRAPGSNACLKESSVFKKSATTDILVPSKPPKNYFVDRNGPKNLTEVHTFEPGLEYHPDVKNDKDFFDKIFANNSYTPSSENLIDHYLEVVRMIETSNYQDRGNVGTVVGSTVVGLVAFLAFSWTIVGGVVGVAVGGALGRAAGKRFMSKRKNKHPMDQEEIYITMVQCAVKLGQIQQHFLKNNLNKYRIAVEKIIEESALTLNFSLFQDQNRVKKTVKAYRDFILTPQSQKAILLGYKLFKRHFNQTDLNNPEAAAALADKLNNVFIPYTKLIQISQDTNDKTLKKLTNLSTYKKIKNFMMHPEVIEILQRYPDLRDSADFIRKSKAFFKLKVDTVDLAEEEQQIMPDGSPINADNHLGLPEIRSGGIRRTIARISALPANVNVSGELNSFDLDEKTMKNQTPQIELMTSMKKSMPKGGKVEHPESTFGLNRKLSSAVVPKKPQSMSIHSPSRIEKGGEDIQFNFDDLAKDEKERQEDLKKVLQDSVLYQGPDDSVKSSSPDGKKNYDKGAFLKITKADSGVMLPLDSVLDDLASQQPSQKEMSAHHRVSMIGTTKHAQTMSLQQLDIQSDSNPMQKPDIVKGNSFANIPNPESKPDSKEEVKELQEEPKPLGSPTLKPGNVTGKERLSSVRFSHIIVNQIQQKTKKELNFEKILSIAYDQESKWEKVVQNQVITIHKIKPENSPVVLLRAWACLEGVTPKDVFNQIYDTTERAKWDSVLADLQVVEKIDAETEIIYFYIRTPFGVTERDFVQQRLVEHDYPEKGSTIMSFQSCTHPAKPVLKSRIRGETTLAGYVIKPSTKVPNSTDFCILSQVDIKGSIPKVVVNMVSGKAPADWIMKLKKACDAAKNKK